MSSIKNILALHCSARTDGSHSRDLTEILITRLREVHPDARLQERDLSAEPLPHVSAEFTRAIFTPPPALEPQARAALALSDRLVEELSLADLIVVGLPMYNYTVPSAFKAWIDHVVRPGVTFAFLPDGYTGLLKGKRAVVVVAAGGVYSTGARMHEDFLTPYVRHILGFIGITDVAFIHAEGLTADPAAGLAAARADISTLVV